MAIYSYNEDKWEMIFSCSFIKYGSKLQYLVAFSVTLCCVCVGMHQGWTSPSLPKLIANDTDIKITADDGSWLVIFSPIGSILGACLGGVAVNKFGRKYALLLATPPYFVSWIMIGFSKSFAVLCIARFIAGVCEGIMYCSFPAYLGEISDHRIRGLLGTLLTIGLTFGVLTVNIVGAYFTIKTTAFAFSIIPIITFLLLLRLPESPYFLLMINKVDAARSCLELLRGVKDVEPELNASLEAIAKLTNTTDSICKKLFVVKANRKALFIIFGIRIVQQCCGISAIKYYAQTIFMEASDLISPVTSSAICFIILIAASIITSLIVDKVGRKPLLIVSAAGSGTSVVIQTVYFYLYAGTNITQSNISLIPVICSVGYFLFFGMGLYTIPLLIECEMLAPDVKSFGMCFASIVYSITVSATTKLFQYTKDEFGMYVPYLLFSVSCGVGIVFVIFCVPETKGKTLEVIQDELAGANKNQKN